LKKSNINLSHPLASSLFGLASKKNFIVKDKQPQADNDTSHLVRQELKADFMYVLGDFSVMLDEDTKALKITTLHPSKHLEIRPKTDNSIQIKSCRNNQ